MSSQRAKLSEISWNDSGSAALKLPRVWSENTTPHPNVASGALRSRTTTSCSGFAFFINSEKYNPAGPPPITATFMGSSEKLRGGC